MAHGNQAKDYPFEAVVLVADPLESPAPDSQTHLRRDLEKTTTHVLKELTGAIRRIGLPCHHYREPAELANAAERHKRDIVLSVYGGENSRNRMALVPAVCESFGLDYIGPDAYARIICQDKEMSKRLATDIGLCTPDYLIIRDYADLGRLNGFQTPFVLKPIWEGSSIGIGPENLVRSTSSGLALAAKLLVH